MLNSDSYHGQVPSGSEPPAEDEGGLHASSAFEGLAKGLVVVRFHHPRQARSPALYCGANCHRAVITQWDLLAAYYDKWTRPASNPSGQLATSSGSARCTPPSCATIQGKVPDLFHAVLETQKGRTPMQEALPAGIVNRVQLSPYRVVLAGVQTWKLDYVPLIKDITAVGFVEFNERGQRKVSARAKGRIDQLFVNQTGQMVDEGDVLASLYSPELNVTVQNLVDAKTQQQPRHAATVLATGCNCWASVTTRSTRSWRPAKRIRT